jgi:hypothetical protein
LTRDYEVTQTQYNALLQRLEQARVSEDAQQTGIVDFQIIDPPTAPFAPAFPSRTDLLVAVLLVALGGGAAVAWVLTKLFPVFSRSQTLAEITGLPVIGVIGVVTANRYRGAVRKDHLRYAAASGTLLLATIVVTAAREHASLLVRNLIS